MSMIEIACFVDIGNHREKNDDRVAVNKKLISDGVYSETVEDNCLVVVCDGVGGNACGDEAAEIVAGYFSGLHGQVFDLGEITACLSIANELVLQTQRTDSNHSKMSTTIAGLFICNNSFIAFNVGDSRIYRFRCPYIMKLSTDHSKSQESIDLGYEPTPGQEHILTRFMGGICVTPNIVDGIEKVFEGDIYVVCSDGVWGSLENEEFEDILSNEETLENKCKALVELALKNGSTDNLSIILVRKA
jgi:protein phosphatase